MTSQDPQSARPSGAEAPERAARPLVTFAVRLYDCEAFVRPTLESAFAQRYRPLEIIVADDCSTDRTYETAQAIVAAYRGPHRVSLFRNERNLGVGSQLEEIRRRMAGEILIIGPASAKTELAKYLREKHPEVGQRIVAVEAADHPSDREIVAYAKQHFKIATLRRRT